METRRLEYFVTLVHERSFRRAAEALYISQPALSQQIQRLERELGVQLIDRTVQPFDLTPAGNKLLAQSQTILDEVREIAETGTQARSGRVGKVKVGIAPSLLSTELPGMISAFRRAYDGVALSLHRDNTVHMHELLKERRLDAALLFSPPTHENLRAADLYTDTFVVALPAGHRLAALETVPLGQLAGENFLMLTRRGVPDLHDAVITACARAGFSPISVDTNLHADGAGYVDQIGLVGSGFGVAIIPSALTTLRVSSVVYRPLVKPKIALATSVAWRGDNHNATLEEFRRFAVSYFDAPGAPREQ